MTVIPLPVRPVSNGSPATRLSTERTMPRRLVHRTAVADVFLTDFVSRGAKAFDASAQLPRAHHHYRDHTGPDADHDPLAVFEAVHQMLLCAMHLHYDAPLDSRMVTVNAALEITDPLPLGTPDTVDLDLRASVQLSTEDPGLPTRAVHRVEVRVAGRPVGSITLDAELHPQDAYRRMRTAHRTTARPPSAALAARPPGQPVAPGLVARGSAANVLLEGARVESDGVLARLRTPTGHGALSDAAHDHVPAAVLMEAARQVSLLTVGAHRGLAPDAVRLSGLTAEYLRLTELDSTVTVLARLLPDSRGTDALAVDVVFEQDGSAVARLRVHLAAPGTGTVGRL